MLTLYIYNRSTKEGGMKSYVDELTDLLQEKMDSVKQLESENVALKAELASMTAKLKEANAIIKDAWEHGDNMDMERAREYLAKVGL
jgi:cell division septum initiation protein DivIVA